MHALFLDLVVDCFHIMINHSCVQDLFHTLVGCWVDPSNPQMELTHETANCRSRASPGPGGSDGGAAAVQGQW
jgi:hypothetical protein